MITLKNIEKYYSNKFVKTWVLRQINLEIKQGEFLTIMGPSGAGKSTLLHIIGMLDEPSGGEYFFNGEPVHKMKERERTRLHQQNIGFVFQQYHLIDDLTVYENLETPLLYKKVKASERKSLVADMLDRFQIVAKKKPVPRPALGRAAAARGRGQGHDRSSQTHSGGRTDGKSSFRPGKRDHATHEKFESSRYDNHSSDALQGKRKIRQ